MPQYNDKVCIFIDPDTLKCTGDFKPDHCEYILDQTKCCFFDNGKRYSNNYGQQSRRPPWDEGDGNRLSDLDNRLLSEWESMKSKIQHEVVNLDPRMPEDF